MTVTKESAVVYRGGGRRWLTLGAAIKAEAVKRIKVKHPTERGETDHSIGYHDPGFHWRELPRSDVLLRRVCRLVRIASDAADTGRHGSHEMNPASASLPPQQTA